MAPYFLRESPHLSRDVAGAWRASRTPKGHPRDSAVAHGLGACWTTTRSNPGWPTIGNADAGVHGDIKQLIDQLFISQMEDGDQSDEDNPTEGFDEEDDATRPMCGGGTDEGEGSDSSAIDSDEANAPLSASTSKPPKVVFSPSFRCHRSCRPPPPPSALRSGPFLSLSHVFCGLPLLQSSLLSSLPSPRPR